MTRKKSLEEEVRFIPADNVRGRLVDVKNWKEAGEVITLHPAIQEGIPDSYAVDPRNGLLIVYAPSRARRIESYKDVKQQQDSGFCVICDGKDTLPNIMVRELPDSKTPDGKQAVAYINENLHPFLDPRGTPHIREYTNPALKGGLFLEWVSNIHTDIHDMSCGDNRACLDLLADLEQMLLHSNGNDDFKRAQSTDHYGHVQIIKNRGKAVGGSVVHGHYQVAYLSTLPQRIEEDVAFTEEHGKSFAKYILDENPINLQIADYGSVVAVVPECCMKRPLEALVIPKDTSKNNLHDLNADERLGVGKALRDITRSLSVVMPQLGKEFAYNLEFHSGPTAFYVEVLPFTQQYGGYERMGFYVCQSTPKLSADIYKAAIAEVRGG